jgi:hypothetical protein
MIIIDVTMASCRSGHTKSGEGFALSVFEWKSAASIIKGRVHFSGFELPYGDLIGLRGDAAIPLLMSTLRCR